MPKQLNTDAMGASDPAGRSRRVERSAATGAPRSHLLLLVYLASLIMLLTLGGGLAVLASAHVSSAAVGASAAADRALVQALLADLGELATDDALDPREVTRAEAVLDRARENVGLLGVALLAPDGTVRADSGALALDEDAADPSSKTPSAVLLDGSDGHRLVESFPAIVDGQVVAVVQIARDAGPLLAAAANAQRDIALGTACGAVVLIVVLFLVFRGAQRRLDRQTAQLIESTRHDTLTGVLTHGAAIAVLARAIDDSIDRPVAVALIDIDNFRRLNETHGHALGDRALLLVTSALKGVAGPGDAIGRSGPDEFVFVAPGRSAHELADSLQAARLEISGFELDTDQGDNLPLTISCGIGVAPLHGRTSTELVSTVAMTLGEAKSGGGDQLVISQLSYAEAARERRTTFSILDGLVNAVNARDRYTRRHSEDVARYALFIAQQLGLESELQVALHQAALLHDVGKIAIPDDVLRKPGTLTSDEYSAMQEHVRLGAILVRDLANAELVVDGVLHHHERWDGTGYPDGLAGEEIPLLARIIAVGDAFSAMTTTRPYRRALTPATGLQRLMDAAETQLDPRLVDVFVLEMETRSDRPLPSDARQPSFWLVPEVAA